MVGKKGVGEKQGTRPTFSALPGSSMELHANSKFKPGLPVHCKCVGFKPKI